MDNETVKELILEKLFNDLVPKLIGYYRIISPERDLWTSNMWYLDKKAELLQMGYDTYLTISTDEKGDFKDCSLSRIQNLNLRNRPYHQDILMQYEPEQQLVLNFDNKKTAIKEMCKIFDIQHLIKFGMCAIKEIEAHEDNSNISIGAIKTILGFKPDTDLINLETRKILTEFIR